VLRFFGLLLACCWQQRTKVNMTKYNLSSNSEDYLEAIYSLSLDQGFARVKDIAQILEVKNPSVTQQIQKLSDMGFVKHESYGVVKLTEKGREIGERIRNRHLFFMELLTDVLFLPDDVAEINACRMEHAVDPITMERFRKLLEFIRENELCKNFHQFLDDDI
jgi:DtxR family Mn-dependent transcriptional regulator